jgi:serine/threonine-protein kinase
LPAAESGSLCARCRLDGEPSSDTGFTDLFTSTRPGQVLESLAASIGSVPRILLPDTADGTTEPPLVNPASPEMPPTADRPVRVQLLGEIGRGGMGVVLKGRDPDLGRDLAVKVLLEAHKEKPDLVRRFVEEAQIGGQLQHPGVVPVYELGTFGDRRPYFTMKLVKGQTLAELLADWESLADDLPRLLGIFEQVCQTMAYAHARDVIHRDLKPSNVMVGSFGEVQVMDWGLAKVLPRGGVVADAEAGKVEVHETVIATARSGDRSNLSQTGSVMGTPAYMAPEQARGELDRTDERADVFALGSILCEILTGQPAFVGRSSGEIHRKAALGDLADARNRLEGSGVDAELVALARDCVAAEPEDRPREAGAVAARIRAYLTGVQEKLRTSERDRAVAEAKAVEERKRRRLQLGLAAAVLALSTMGGLGTTYFLQQRSARAAAVAKVLSEASTLRDLAKGRPEDPAGWSRALVAVKQAEGAAGEDGDASRWLAALRAEVEAGAAAAERDRLLLDRLIDIRSAKADDRDGWATDSAYTGAFREAGIDVAALTPPEAGARIKARPAAVAVPLAAALDDWAAVRRERRSDRAGAERLAQAARAADPDAWRGGLRDALDLPERKHRLDALRALARTVKFDELPPVSLDLLGSALRDTGDPQTAESILRRAQRRHPGDVGLNYDFAQCLEKLARREEAIRYYTAARSIRPDVAHDLAHALDGKGEPGEAVAVFQELTRLRPDFGRHFMCLATALKSQGRAQEASVALDAAIALLREHIRQRPEDAAAHDNLATALLRQSRLEESIAEYREAIRLRPESGKLHDSLGDALRRKGKQEEAMAECREAIRLEPDFVIAHISLGVILCDDKHDYGAAAAVFREAIRLQPASADAHLDLGVALKNLGQMAEAITEQREAVRLAPTADKHTALGATLRQQWKIDEALVEYREVLRLKPDAASDNDLAWTLVLSPRRPRGDYDEGLVRARKAVGLAPQDGNFANTLALAEYRSGHWPESIAAALRSIELLKNVDPSNWFFLAMAHGQKRSKDEGRKWFEKAVAWTKEKDAKNPELLQFWTEAAELLGQPGPGGTGAGSPTAPADEEPQ